MPVSSRSPLTGTSVSSNNPSDRSQSIVAGSELMSRATASFLSFAAALTRDAFRSSVMERTSRNVWKWHEPDAAAAISWLIVRISDPAGLPRGQTGCRTSRSAARLAGLGRPHYPPMAGWRWTTMTGDVRTDQALRLVRAESDRLGAEL